MSQNQLGLHLSNYGGTTGLAYNPSSFHFGPLAWDAHILSGGTFAETDYAYFQNTHVLELLRGDKPIVKADQDFSASSNSRITYRFNPATRNMHNSTNAFLGSPAFAKRQNRNFSWGVFYRLRQAFSANQLDLELSEPSVNAWQIPETRIIKPTRTTGMVWSEIAVNAAYGKRVKNKKLSVGVNTKILVGHQGLFLHSPNEVQLTKLDSNLLAEPSDLKYVFTNVDEQFNLKNNGNGAALDFGITIQDTDYFTKPRTFRLSISVLDLGFVNFKWNSEYHEINTIQNSVIPENTFNSSTSIKTFSRGLSQVLTRNPNATYNGPRFTIFTPASLNISLDYHLAKHFFVNTFFSRRFIFHPQQIEKENIVVTSLRYETPFFEVGSPLTLYNDQDLRAGFWFRIGFITVGSDNFLPLFVEQRQLSGADIYFALRINNLSQNLFKRQKPSQKEQCFW